MRGSISIFTLMIILFSFGRTSAQSFYFGADLSYVNEMEDCGAVFNVGGTTEDPYQIFLEHGTNLVRLRLWHTPSWYDALNQGHRYSDLQDVRHSIMRAKAEGMQVLLDFHLSDTWADPSHQIIPGAWLPVLDSLDILKDSLYNYIYNTLANLAADSLLPEIVQIGNETNKGILQSKENNDAGFTLFWPKNSVLFNAAITAVRNISTTYNKPIKIALHIANPLDVDWMMSGFWSHGVRDFDIIGISYYFQFHQADFAYVGSLIDLLKLKYSGKEVMIFETAYQWTNANADGANNILSSTYPGYTPPSKANQLKWMIDLTQTVIDHGGKGVIYWEPAWVSTSCFTQFGKGSNWDNATFFDSNERLIEDGGIGWMTHQYDFTLSTGDGLTSSNHIKVFQSGDELIFKRDDASILNDPFDIDLMSVDGKKKNSIKIEPDWRNNVIRIKVPDLMQGCYFISGFRKNKFLFSKMFVVVKN